MTTIKIPLILYLQIVAFRALNKKCFINAAAIDEQQEGRSFPFSNRSQELFISTHDATTGARVALKAPRQVHNPIIQENQRRTTKKRRTSDINSASCLYQADFDQGTKIITEPGSYKLCEDITFYPLVNPPETSSEGAANAFEPIFPGPFDENAFGLGFFAALSIATSDVTLYLNDYTIQQSKEHALLQRFFAVIELADSPFIQGVGPAQFVGESSSFNPASNIKILGPGTIGLSSHHGIHGNENQNVLIKFVKFERFEVAAVSLNNVDRLVIRNCRVIQNRHDVPILGMFSAAKFIRPYGKVLKDHGYEMTLRGVQTSAADVYDRLVESINNVYDDVMKYGKIMENVHKSEHKLFHNEPGVVDGPCYAFLVHGKGPAVGDYGFKLSSNSNITSSRILIKENKINNIKCWVNEIPAAIENNKVMNDARGSVLQFIRSTDNAPIAMESDGTYKGNVVADMQIMVAKAINEDVIEDSAQLQTVVNSIDETIIGWASSSNLTYQPKYRCNGDSMHHVNKGITVIRVDDTVGFRIEDNVITSVSNLSPSAFDNCFDYNRGTHFRAEDEQSNLQQGSNIRGVSVAAVSGFHDDNYDRSLITGNKLIDFSSINGKAIVGIDVQNRCDSIEIKDNIVDLHEGIGHDQGDAYLALRIQKNKNSEEFSIIFDKTNNFSQEIKVLSPSNAISSDLEAADSVVHARSRVIRCPSKTKDLEWEVGTSPGGCPFGFKKKMNMNIFE
mmetsp:Transcript_5475/g.8143  ORF Transcript_5475/g.8143 Transcript_5475/m.8143 type:complete len:733 (+) Transcript_5475:32-2230(+)